MNDKPKINKFARQRARKLALQALYQWHIAKTNFIDLEKQYLKDTNPKKIDIEYFQMLLHEVSKHAAECDALIQPHCDREQEHIGPIELTILRMGTYELAHRIDIPYRVVINEACELSKIYGPEQSHKYINGILDKVAHMKRRLEIDNESA